jgi:hypothetical protein
MEAGVSPPVFAVVPPSKIAACKGRPSNARNVPYTAKSPNPGRDDDDDDDDKNKRFSLFPPPPRK